MDRDLAEPRPAPPAGRILRALENPQSSPVPEIIKRRPRKRKPVAASILAWIGGQSEPVAPDPEIAPRHAVAPAGHGQPAALEQVPKAPRLRVRAARSDFPLGERWKARLPEPVRTKRNRSPTT